MQPSELASFIWQNAFEIHPGYYMLQCFSLQNTIPLYGCTTVCLSTCQSAFWVVFSLKKLWIKLLLKSRQRLLCDHIFISAGYIYRSGISGLCSDLLIYYFSILTRRKWEFQSFNMLIISWYCLIFLFSICIRCVGFQVCLAVKNLPAI